eukprot:CAMPEP_0197878006 /NCGR_PEP_ID=MMETSP1439-20131203/6515_1 /TAXON_ID=66791 /ORGANISM="Gonyaulax spinifera, Strain CCMP409" /LENGTH=233 /DNA_ID=CAMNT_0043497383 /DNA_START=105 /DNA_END=806 /DNA_ORIENTATION=+
MSVLAVLFAILAIRDAATQASCEDIHLGLEDAGVYIHMDAEVEHGKLIDPVLYGPVRRPEQASATQALSSAGDGPQLAGVSTADRISQLAENVTSITKRVMTASPAALLSELTGQKLHLVRLHDTSTIHELIKTHHREWTTEKFVRNILITSIVGILALWQLRVGFVQKGRVRSPFSVDKNGATEPPWVKDSQVELSPVLWSGKNLSSMARTRGPASAECRASSLDGPKAVSQ